MGNRFAESLALLPPVETILADPRLGDLAAEPRPLVRAWARAALDDLRMEIRADGWRPRDRKEALDRVLDGIRARTAGRLPLRLRFVWNATGILLHTNLGRAVLPAEVRRAVLAVASGASSLEIDLATGRRVSRLRALRELIPLLTGAEAGFAVNNNAAGLFLAMAAIARGKEVLVSRGQLVEIGGSFRLPEILEAAGARLREVGTTNRTRIEDYARARTSDTAVVLRVHRSNFRLVGFSEDPSLAELSKLCREEGLILVDDLGSGALRAYRDLFPEEPAIEESIEGGADLVCFSADKLLGIGQGGILAGRRSLVETIQKHPIARTVRLDKILLAMLEAGIGIHLRGAEHARREIPLLRALGRPPASIEAAAERTAGRLREALGREYAVATCAVEGEVGGGSLPGETLMSHAVALCSTTSGPDEIGRRLRAGDPPVVGRIREDRLLLDLRAIPEEEEEEFAGAVCAALAGGPSR